ncbi:MAG: hypothetical protein ACFCBW_01240 [Candidatus Competibacterales bacterium]
MKSKAIVQSMALGLALLSSGTIVQAKAVVSIHQHCDFRGYHIELPPGHYDLPHLRQRGMVNDDISALKVPQGYRVWIYQHAGFRGKFRQLRSSDSCLLLSGFNDQISSIKVERIPRGVHGVNGYNVTKVYYPGGVFEMGRGNRWLERNRDGRHHFVEQNRDEWSVYLMDRSRGVQIQLDLHRKEIFYRHRQEPRRVLYRISRAEAKKRLGDYRGDGRRVDGYNVGEVHYRGGVFKNTGGHHWKWRNRKGHLSLIEQNRDEWSVYLLNPSKKIRIQLDLHRKEVFYSRDHSPRQASRPIKKVKAM